MKSIKNIFLAGKITKNDWRQDILKGGVALQSTDSEYPCALHEYAAHDGIGKSLEWPIWEKAILGLFNYVGPYYIGCHKVGVHGSRTCGCDLSGYNHGCYDDHLKSEVFKLSEERIRQADLVFAWIDDLSAYGTFAEIGMAKALEKEILIASPVRFDDLDMIYDMAFTCSIGVDEPDDQLTPMRAFLQLLNFRFDHGYRPLTVSYDLLSPIEAKFLEAWNEINTHYLSYGSYSGPEHRYWGLFPQYPILRYRVDFAHIETKIAIELDGLEAHRTTDQIAYDRKRQREIEEMGWHVVRFGGKEVHHDAEQCALEARKILREKYEKHYKDLIGEHWSL